MREQEDACKYGLCFTGVLSEDHREDRGDITYGEFVIHLILGQSFILLSEKGKKKNLSLLEKIDLMFKTYKNLL